MEGGRKMSTPSKLFVVENDDDDNKDDYDDHHSNNNYNNDEYQQARESAARLLNDIHDLELLSSHSSSSLHKLSRQWRIGSTEPAASQQSSFDQTDFSRVRPYLLAGQAAHWRQLTVCSSMAYPLILSSFKRYDQSAGGGRGSVKIRRKYPLTHASISSVWLPTRQVFRRVAATSFASAGADRLQYFMDKIWPALESKR
jgi:hypothetical protein